MRTGREEKINNKVAHCFYSKVLELVNLTTRCGEEFTIITSSLSKKKLQQDQEKITKTNKNQFESKKRQTKIGSRTTSKNNETKRDLCQKKKIMLTKKNALALFVKQFQKRVKWIGLFVEYTQSAGMKILHLVLIILGVRLFTQIIDLINTTTLFLDIYM